MCAASQQVSGSSQSETVTTLNIIGPASASVGLGSRIDIQIPSFNQTWLDAERDFGTVGDGVADDTIALNSAIQASGAQRRPLIIPAGSYKISTQMLVPSNAVIFGYGAVLLNYTDVVPEESYLGVALVVSSERADSPVTDVKIYGIEIDGRRASQTVGKAGLKVQGNVRNLLVKDCYFHDNSTDGWLMIRSSLGDDLIPEHCVFEDVVCLNNSRQGASISVGRHIVIRGGDYSQTGGEPPSAGIDIEPDVPGTACENILIQGVRFADNAGAGLLFDYVGAGVSPIRNVRVSDCQMSGNGFSGVTIRAAEGVSLRNCLIDNNLDSGIELNTYEQSPLIDIQVQDGRIYNNGSGGVFGVLNNDATSGKSWKFLNMAVFDNGYTDSDQFHGMQFQGVIDDIQVIGCTVQNRTTENQAYGLVTGEGVTRLRADLNNFSENAQGSVSLLDDFETRRYGSSNNE
ncbi:MAG: right-handed parallel beta-helix repeat-containing protein [Thermomicrobiales bacterium]